MSVESLLFKDPAQECEGLSCDTWVQTQKKLKECVEHKKSGQDTRVLHTQKMCIEHVSSTHKEKSVEHVSSTLKRKECNSKEKSVEHVSSTL